MNRRVALSDFHEAMKAANVVALWELEDATNDPPEPPQIWRWETLEPLLETAIEATSMSNAERRVLVLNNPALLESGRSARAPASRSGFNLQILMPAETARPHRHSMNALRFVMEGDGATTIVDGKPCPMEPGDMILTPGWTWHEHVHEGDGRMIWLDVLDVPFHHYLDTGEFEPGPAPRPARPAAGRGFRGAGVRARLGRAGHGLFAAVPLPVGDRAPGPGRAPVRA